MSKQNKTKTSTAQQQQQKQQQRQQQQQQQHRRTAHQTWGVQVLFFYPGRKPRIQHSGAGGGQVERERDGANTTRGVSSLYAPTKKKETQKLIPVFATYIRSTDINYIGDSAPATHAMNMDWLALDRTQSTFTQSARKGHAASRSDRHMLLAKKIQENSGAWQR